MDEFEANFKLFAFAYLRELQIFKIPRVMFYI